MLNMEGFSVVILLIFIVLWETSTAVNTYCSLPCPFFYPAAAPKTFGGYPPPRRPSATGRASYYEYEDYEDLPECQPQPCFRPRLRSVEPKPEPKAEPKPEPKAEPKAEPKPEPENTEKPPEKKPKSPPEESVPPESAPKKKERCPPPPCAPPKRFFTTLCSIPGAVVDTMLSGEIVV